MNIIFMGTPEFAVESLKKIDHSRHQISAVVSVPDKPRGRGRKVSPSAVKQYAIQNNLPVLQPENLKDDAFIGQLKTYSADLFVIVAFRILPEAVFSLPQFGSINLHASLLPAFRGAAPINRAIMSGAKETGVSTFFLKKKVDTGNIIYQDKISLSTDMTAGELHDRLMVSGADLLLKTIDAIEAGTAENKDQDDTLASGAAKIFPEDCKIDWQRNAEEIHNQIRGLDPYPGAFTYFGDQKIKLFASHNPQKNRQLGRVGQFLNGIDSITVQCGKGCIEFFEIQPANKRRMTVKDFLLGHTFADNPVFD